MTLTPDNIRGIQYRIAQNALMMFKIRALQLLPDDVVKYMNLDKMYFDLEVLVDINFGDMIVHIDSDPTLLESYLKEARMSFDTYRLVHDTIVGVPKISSNHWVYVNYETSMRIWLKTAMFANLPREALVSVVDQLHEYNGNQDNIYIF